MNQAQVSIVQRNAQKRSRFSPPPAVQLQRSAQELNLCRSQLARYFPETVNSLSADQLENAFNDLQKRPLLLALQDPYSLGHLSFSQYHDAMHNFRPEGQLLQQRHFDQLVLLMQTADYYLHLGYRLTLSDVSVSDTVDRVVLGTALQEIGIGFQEATRRLNWPGVLAEQQRLELLFSRLPRVDPGLTAPRATTLEDQLRAFEMLSPRPGSWIITLTSFVSKRSAKQPAVQRMFRTLAEDQCVVIDLSFAMWPDALLASIGTARSVCFLSCNPVPLSFWLTFSERLGTSFSPVSVLFVFEPTLDSDSELLKLLRSAGFPELEINVDDSRSLGFAPDYDPSEGLNSEALYNPKYFRRSMISALGSPPKHWVDLPPISWIPEQHYSEVVEWFSHLCSDPEISVRFATSTKYESNQIWTDIRTVLELPDYPLESMRVVLRADPMGAPLIVSSISADGYYTLKNNGQDEGNNFVAAELEQAYVCPLERLVHRHYDLLFYFSTQPIDSHILYRLAAASYRRLVIISEAENLDKLFPG